MTTKPRWDRCIEHHGSDAQAFATEYFGQADRQVVLIAGAGFDPRSVAGCRFLQPAASRVRAVLVKEERPKPAGTLVQKATDNVAAVKAILSSVSVRPIEIFGTDNAVIGGRQVVTMVHDLSFANVTDVVVDLSALSVGTSYPIVRYLYERAIAGSPRNLHVLVSPDPRLDEAITPIAGDTVGFVHGFRGGWALDERAGAAKLWLPQLARGRGAALQRIHDFIGPHDTCPIVPFPSSRPRLSDELVESFISEIESAWQVDTRNLIHASEEDPLDLYRTILRIDDLRRPVFEEVGGSLLVLSPMGSKVLALGALLAALERDIPVAYLEAIAYEMGPAPVSPPTELIHLWLAGDVYTDASHA